jgi:hypothetical protein
MSVRTMSRVWSDSQHAGSELLMLLAIADFADDDGNAYPSVAALARKCRMQPRNANYVLVALQKSGELEVRVNEGPRGTNRYRIKLVQMADGLQRGAGVQRAAGVQAGAGMQRSAVVQRGAGVQGIAPTPATECAEPLHQGADEPSVNHQEPSERATSSPASPPVCPHRRLLALFVEKLPELPKPRPELWAGKSADALAARWKWVLKAERENGTRYATNAEEAVEWFGKFFDTVAASDFLTGRSGKFKCPGLAWLMKSENFAKVIEGNYENRDPA